MKEPKTWGPMNLKLRFFQNLVKHSKPIQILDHVSFWISLELLKELVRLKVSCSDLIISL
ncbi:hypothetical protein PanWU01x14_354250 [Parasponia andersonii]|uniref:Uncharacterized protein n=1 Tax=Parasponia andersonii TaxID=3476 RepID=A0A2P5A9P9_PARAD|nr:hypothetical protein PanWU01x14_354250 [Parasponia andersonii]